jgi:branched-chain amino acid aminotransferase
MAAGTAAALVPIRSITRRVDPASPVSITSAVKQHPRLSSGNGEEKIAYIEESQEEAGPICEKLITQLKGIQLGKVKDEFGWCAPVSGSDGTKIAVAPNGTH